MCARDKNEESGKIRVSDQKWIHKNVKPTKNKVELGDLRVPHFLVHGVAVVSVRLAAESLLPAKE